MAPNPKKLGKESILQTESPFASEDLYRNAFDAAIDGIAIVDERGIYLDVNHSYCKMLGYSYDELIGMSPADSICSDYRYQLMEEFIPQIQKTGRVRLDSMIIRKDGVAVPIELHGVRFFHSGSPAFMAVIRDLSERKRAEAELAASEERYRFLTDNVADGVMVVQDGKVVFTNNACAHMFCHENTSGALVEISVEEFFYADVEKRFARRIREIESGEQSKSFLHEYCRTTDGREFWVGVRYKIIRWEGRPGILFAIRDITEAKLKEITNEEEKRYLFEENIKLRSAMKERYRFGDIIGRSATMQEVYDLILRASASDANVAIYGESGTGKELIARTIHQLSSRKDKPFVPVNCGAIPEKLFESEFFGHRKGSFTGAIKDKPGFFDIAHEGTLFLDEVSELRHEHQVKLLRAIEGGGYSPVGDNRVIKRNVRIIAATNTDPNQLILKGILREDFFFRIHIIPIILPPLRDRREDIPLLAEYFCQRYSEEAKPKIIPGYIMDSLCAYEWPGNVRQLENVVQRYITLGRLDFLGGRGTEIMKGEQFLFDSVNKNGGLYSMLEAFEKQYILRVLEQCNWHRGKASSYLRIPPRTLYRKIKKYQLANE